MFPVVDSNDPPVMHEAYAKWQEDFPDMKVDLATLDYIHRVKGTH